MTNPFAAVILAAGKGTRMKSDLHKVLHPIAGRPMLEHLFASVKALGPERQVVVIGSGREQLEPVVPAHGGSIAVQDPQLGTAHAVQQAEAGLQGFEGDVLILYGDTPLVEPETMRRMLERLHWPGPAGGGRTRISSRRFRCNMAASSPRATAPSSRWWNIRMRATKSAPANLCNSGLMAVRASDLFALLARVGNDNAAQEYYLPDIVMIAAADGRKSAVIETAEWEVAGINSRAELAAVEAEWQRRRGSRPWPMA
jgi:bifunctional UDP-N-acetylglucosamine pyrophosphorylase/glucosamine-1-phosphate N-acetyltransferase